MGEFQRAAAVAAEFGISVHEAAALRGQGLGWGEVRQVLAISKRSGKPVARVVQLRNSGMTLRRVAERCGPIPGMA
ncbi:MAG: hypothetical protein HYZ75_05260 [Elusimicrobia bacterium]|nr:hypothetical protein [Elusimicrobiota bacterium]